MLVYTDIDMEAHNISMELFMFKKIFVSLGKTELTVHNIRIFMMNVFIFLQVWNADLKKLQNCDKKCARVKVQVLQRKTKK